MTLIETIKKDAKTAKWVGIFLLIAGFLSLAAPLGAGVSLTVMIGVLLLMTGAAQLLIVFKAGSFGDGILLAVLAVLTLAAGGYMVTQPIAALATLTLFLAAYFIASGVIQIIGAFGARPEPGWGWLLFGGIVSLLLGAMLWRQFPLSGIWAIGTLVGIQLLISGWSLLVVGGMAGSVAKAADEAGAP